MAVTIEQKVMLCSWATVFNCEDSRRLFHDRYEIEAPSARTILFWKNKLLETGTLVKDRARSGRPISASRDSNKIRVLDAVTNDPTISTRQISIETDITQSSVTRLLKASNYHAYKPLYSQFLCNGDSNRRLQFAEIMCAKYQNDRALVHKLTFSDECVFSLSVHVNKHNVHYFSAEKPTNFQIFKPGKTQ